MKNNRTQGKPRSATPTVAIYARVSTTDQDASMQVRELRAYVRRMGWRTAGEFVETASGRRGAVRPELEKLMEAARLRKFDVVLVWKVDRFGRSVSEFVERVQALDQSGIRFIALTQGIDTDRASPQGNLLMHILAAIAEFERDLISERVKAGMSEAKRRGQHCGRPWKIFPRGRIANLRRLGWSWRKIAQRLGVPQSTVRKATRTSPD